jgi:hypothetical protein
LGGSDIGRTDISKGGNIGKEGRYMGRVLGGRDIGRTDVSKGGKVYGKGEI